VILSRTGSQWETPGWLTPESGHSRIAHLQRTGRGFVNQNLRRPRPWGLTGANFRPSGEGSFTAQANAALPSASQQLIPAATVRGVSGRGSLLRPVDHQSLAALCLYFETGAACSRASPTRAVQSWRIRNPGGPVIQRTALNKQGLTPVLSRGWDRLKLRHRDGGEMAYFSITSDSLDCRYQRLGQLVSRGACLHEEDPRSRWRRLCSKGPGRARQDCLNDLGPLHRRGPRVLLLRTRLPTGIFFPSWKLWAEAAVAGKRTTLPP
jgi:hypothetical protein